MIPTGKSEIEGSGEWRIGHFCSPPRVRGGVGGGVLLAPQISGGALGLSSIRHPTKLIQNLKSKIQNGIVCNALC